MSEKPPAGTRRKSAPRPKAAAKPNVASTSAKKTASNGENWAASDSAQSRAAGIRFTTDGPPGSFYDPDAWTTPGETKKPVKTSRPTKVDPSSEPPEENFRRDVNTGAMIPAADWRESDTARVHIALVEEYSTYRAYGVDGQKAFLRVFGTGYADLWLTDRVEALEHNPVFRALFARKFESLKVGEMWSLKQAVFELLSLVNHPFVKDTVRFSALKELNVIYGITMVDDQGRTTRGKSLKDFYNEQVPNSPVIAQTIAAHPAPGSVESAEFLERNAPPSRSE
jgi:hypothetical protein